MGVAKLDVSYKAHVIKKKPRGRPPKAVRYITKRTMDYIKKVDELNLDGSNVSENWRVFWQNYQIFATAAGVDKMAEPVRVAIFLNAIGPAAVEVFNAFNLTTEQKSKYDEVTKAFENFCKPKKNEVYESFLFFNRNQSSGEPFDNFLMALKKMVRNCGFGDQEDRMIRDRIVMGTCNKALQKKLLEKDDLDLHKAIEICRATEATQNQHQEMQKSGAASVDSISNKYTTNNFQNFNNRNKNLRYNNNNNKSNSQKF